MVIYLPPFKQLRKKTWFRISSSAILLLIFFLGSFVILNPFAKNPVPEDIRPKVHFKIVYPAGNGYQINPGKWSFSDQQQALSFTVEQRGYSVIVTEEKVPLEFRDDQAAFDRFIGTLRPTLTFNSHLGSVSVAAFVSGAAGSFAPEGTSGILKTHGILFVAHPSKVITDDQWEQFFAALQVAG